MLVQRWRHIARLTHCHAPFLLVCPAPHRNNTVRSIFGWFDAAFNKVCVRVGTVS